MPRNPEEQYSEFFRPMYFALELRTMTSGGGISEFKTCPRWIQQVELPHESTSKPEPTDIHVEAYFCLRFWVAKAAIRHPPTYSLGSSGKQDLYQE